MIILQRCPNCGSEAKFFHRLRGSLWQRIAGLGWIDWVVRCTRNHKHATAEGRTQEAAATEWNSYKPWIVGDRA